MQPGGMPTAAKPWDESCRRERTTAVRRWRQAAARRPVRQAASRGGRSMKGQRCGHRREGGRRGAPPRPPNDAPPCGSGWEISSVPCPTAIRTAPEQWAACMAAPCTPPSSARADAIAAFRSA
eukprot:scaffold6994_cov101-Isochrysis_galbana.AAC.5